MNNEEKGFISGQKYAAADFKRYCNSCNNINEVEVRMRDNYDNYQDDYLDLIVPAEKKLMLGFLAGYITTLEELV